MRTIILFLLFSKFFIYGDIWTPELVLSIKQINEVIVSPDHQHTVYLVKQANLTEGQWDVQLYLVDNTSLQTKKIAENLADISNLSWSMEGEKIYFLAKEQSKKAIWEFSLGSSHLKSFFEAENDIDSYAISPNNSIIAFTADVPVNQKYPLVKEYGKQTPKGLWIKKSDSEVPILLTNEKMVVGARDNGLLSWSSDNNLISFTYSIIEKDNAYEQSWISHVAIADVSKNSFTDLIHDSSMNINAIFSHDGEWVAYASSASSLARNEAKQFFFFQICLISKDGKKRKSLAETFDQRPTLLGWHKSDKFLLVQERKGIKNKLYQLDVDGKSPISLIPEDSKWNPLYFLNAPGDYLGFVDGQFQAPPEAFITPVMAFEPKQISFIQPEIKNKLARVELIQWPSDDGKNIEGIFITPFDSTKKPFPLVLAYHGGPTTQWSEEYLGSALNQSIPFSFGMLANAGYAVLAVNIRGSTGYGPSFARANYQDLGGSDFKDALAGIDYLMDQKLVDQNRLAVWGWSYGGYLSAWTITQTPRFKCCVMGAALTDLISFDGTSTLSQIYLPSYFSTYFWQNPDLYFQRSPIMHVGKVKTPTLMQYGDKDLVVPSTQGAEFFNALNIRKVPVSFYIFPDEGHAFTNNPQSVVIGLQQLLDILNRNLCL